MNFNDFITFDLMMVLLSILSLIACEIRIRKPLILFKGYIMTMKNGMPVPDIKNAYFDSPELFKKLLKPVLFYFLFELIAIIIFFIYI